MSGFATSGNAIDFQGRVLNLFESCGEWSDETFGSPDIRGPVGPLKHLAKEVKEALEVCESEIPFKASLFRMEMADLLLLVADAARRGGIDFQDLLTAAEIKFEMNKQREWPEPGDPNEPVEHKRELRFKFFDHQGGECSYQDVKMLLQDEKMESGSVNFSINTGLEWEVTPETIDTELKAQRFCKNITNGSFSPRQETLEHGNNLHSPQEQGSTEARTGP